MKYLLCAAIFFFACKKETTVITQYWRRSEWCDTVSIPGDPYYCDSLRNCKRVDTVPVVYNDGEPNDWYPLAITPPIMIDAPYEDSVIRKYYRYLKQVK